MDKQWKLKPAGDERLTKKLSSAININPVLAGLLVQRGIDSFEQAKVFFRPSLHDLHNPFLMKDMDKAIFRIEKALENDERILIYGDYDVDGTTAVALVYSFLQKRTKNISFYIPDRNSEGYGISFKAIDYAADNEIALVIALDCGIKDVKKISYANSKNIDFIICDHHTPGDELPDAIAVLDPKRKNCEYPFKELSGCGIGYKLLQAFTMKNKNAENELLQNIDLVAISTAADIVPVTGENRIFMYYGLKKINISPRVGIEELLKSSGINRIELNEEKPETVFSRLVNVHDLVFVISPRINAAGRMETGEKSVELLISEDETKANELAKSIEENNKQRKSIEEQTIAEALEMIENDIKYANQKATIVYDAGWHKGVIGIVASRLIENVYRPTIVFTLSNGLITGSARSVKNFDIYNAIEACSELLENFGGHKYAAGLSMKPENFEKFKQKFNEVVASTIGEDSLTPELTIDSELDMKLISPEFYNVLKQFAPFGPGNMTPVFLSCGVTDKGFAKIVKEKHLKMNIVFPGSKNISYDAIAFDHSIHFENVSNKKYFDICYTIEENEWNGEKKLQLKIKDISFKD